MSLGDLRKLDSQHREPPRVFSKKEKFTISPMQTCQIIVQLEVHLYSINWPNFVIALYAVQVTKCKPMMKENFGIYNHL